MSAERRKRLIDDSGDAKAFIKLGRDIVSVTLPTSCCVVLPPLRLYRICLWALQLCPDSSLFFLFVERCIQRSGVYTSVVEVCARFVIELSQCWVC